MLFDPLRVELFKFRKWKNGVKHTAVPLGAALIFMNFQIVDDFRILKNPGVIMLDPANFVLKQGFIFFINFRVKITGSPVAPVRTLGSMIPDNWEALFRS